MQTEKEELCTFRVLIQQQDSRMDTQSWVIRWILHSLIEFVLLFVLYCQIHKYSIELEQLFDSFIGWLTENESATISHDVNICSVFFLLFSDGYRANDERIK